MLAEPITAAKPRRRVRQGLAERLRRSVLSLTEGHGAIEQHKERAWASITFTGTRHTIRLRFSGADGVEAGERLIAQLPDHEFAIAGQLVADAAITAAQHTLLPVPSLTVTCELLLLEDA